MKSKRLIESKAESLVRQLNVTEPPIPVELLARHLGARIHYQPFDSPDVSGMLYREEGKPPIIGVNDANADVRKRFTVAHEVAHLVLHPGQPLILDRQVRVNFRDATSSTATDEQEIEANAFAAALLMPGPLVHERLQHHLVADLDVADGELVHRLAADFQVSDQAMQYRLINLGLLTPA